MPDRCIPRRCTPGRCTLTMAGQVHAHDGRVGARPRRQRRYTRRAAGHNARALGQGRWLYYALGIRLGRFF